MEKTISFPKRTMFLMISLMVLTIVLSACSPNSSDPMSEVSMAPLSSLPVEVRQASTSVQEAYQFAMANPDVLKQIPCYCGCGAVGHTSNYSCYVQSDEGGEVLFDSHALGCGICVDIALDARSMLRDGKTITEIKADIDAKYSQYGPSNMP